MDLTRGKRPIHTVKVFNGGKICQKLFSHLCSTVIHFVGWRLLYFEHQTVYKRVEYLLIQVFGKETLNLNNVV